MKALFTLDWSERWKAMLAVVYCIVILFDFVIHPVVVDRTQMEYNELVRLSMKLAPGAQVEALKRRKWESLTLSNGGIFHLAVGSVLTGVAVFGRGGKRSQDSELTYKQEGEQA